MPFPYTLPFQLDGDGLMALTDAEQRELLTKVRDIWNDRKLLQNGAHAAVNFAWEGHAQLGVTDGKQLGGDGKPIPKGLPLSFIDWAVRKFGKA